MKKYVSLLVIALMFCAVISVGCGGGSDNDSGSVDNEDTGGENTTYDPNEEGRGGRGAVIDLSAMTENYTVEEGEILTKSPQTAFKISIADGATITLRNVTINGITTDPVSRRWSYEWAGLTCLGDATIILEGTNSVRGFHYKYPGIYVPEGKTLTIKGNGSLTASSNGYASGIGGGDDIPCGNIVIEGGTIKATGGGYAAGIGAGSSCNCGNITITGGTVTATGGFGSAGIGGGYYSNCSSITITDKVTKVTAVKGEEAPYSIGAGRGRTCEMVTVGGKVGQISDSPYTYQPNK